MRGPNLTDDERHRIACILFENSINSKPKRGIMKTLAVQFQVHRRTIWEVWRVAKHQRQNGQELNLKSKLPGKQGRATLEVPYDKIRGTSKAERSTLEKLALAIGVSTSTVAKWVRQGKIRCHTSTLHPDLTTDNKYMRLNFVLSKLYFDRILNAIKFNDMGYIIHIDEKWFYITQECARYYLAEDEDEPYRSCKSKRFITKVMFMAAVSRPIYDENGNVIFDGKIGIFPFTFQEPAKRRSKNRVAGTMETKSVVSVTKQVIREMLINKVVPAIKTKWPSSSSKNIVIQQDNARPHIKGNDLEFIQAGTSDGFNITLSNQPANSPDLNVLDLGFFRSIQSLQIVKPATTVDTLVANVQEAWEEEPVEKLNDVWLSLQSCMLEIMKRKGHNDYKLPHLGKKAQRKAGTLPRNLEASEELVKECMEYLLMVGKTTNLEELFRDLGITIPN